MYPTKSEILAEPAVLHRPKVLRFVKVWKKDTWLRARLNGDSEKFDAVADLLTGVALLYSKPVSVQWFGNESASSFYLPRTKTIVINGKPSIVTALHELGHHLFGSSELKACRWSVHLFMKCFPRAYASLVWEGHMLVRPTEGRG